MMARCLASSGDEGKNFTGGEKGGLERRGSAEYLADRADVSGDAVECRWEREQRFVCGDR